MQHNHHFHNSPSAIKSKDSVPCLSKQATGPYSELDISSLQSLALML